MVNWLKKLIWGRCCRCKGTGISTWFEFNYDQNRDFPCQLCGGTGVKQ
jgi:hypothetical protein